MSTHRLRRRYGHTRAFGPHPMTLADAKTLLRPLDVILTKKDGEYRVVRRGGSEESAYYTDDLWDAYETGKLKQYDPGRRATPTGPRAHGQMRQRATD